MLLLFIGPHLSLHTLHSLTLQLLPSTVKVFLCLGFLSVLYLNLPIRMWKWGASPVWLECRCFVYATLFTEPSYYHVETSYPCVRQQANVEVRSLLSQGWLFKTSLWFVNLPNLEKWYNQQNILASLPLKRTWPRWRNKGTWMTRKHLHVNWCV